VSIPVVLDVKVRRGRRSKCSLYSVDPSCGSASSFVIPVSCRSIGVEYDCERVLLETRWGGSSFPLAVGVMLPGVDHGEETLGGFGSYVNIDAILGRRGMYQCIVSVVCLGVPPYIP
jgi:hypothetical protein